MKKALASNCSCWLVPFVVLSILCVMMSSIALFISVSSSNRLQQELQVELSRIAKEVADLQLKYRVAETENTGGNLLVSQTFPFKFLFLLSLVILKKIQLQSKHILRQCSGLFLREWQRETVYRSQCSIV